MNSTTACAASKDVILDAAEVSADVDGAVLGSPLEVVAGAAALAVAGAAAAVEASCATLDVSIGGSAPSNLSTSCLPCVVCKGNALEWTYYSELNMHACMHA